MMATKLMKQYRVSRGAFAALLMAVGLVVTAGCGLRSTRRATAVEPTLRGDGLQRQPAQEASGDGDGQPGPPTDVGLERRLDRR